MKKALLFVVLCIFFATTVITSANMQNNPDTQKISPLYKVRIFNVIQEKITKTYENRFQQKLFFNFPDMNLEYSYSLRNNFMLKTSGHPRIPTSCLQCITAEYCQDALN